MINMHDASASGPPIDSINQKVDGLTESQQTRINLLSFGIQYDGSQNEGCKGGVETVDPRVAKYFVDKAGELGLPLSSVEVNLGTIGQPNSDARTIEEMAVDWGITPEQLLTNDNNPLESYGPVQVALLVNVSGDKAGDGKSNRLASLMYRILGSNGNRVAVCFKFDKEEQVMTMLAADHLRPMIRSASIRV